MTDVLWTSQAIVAATGGVLDGPPFEARGLSIDTRSLELGDLFVALGGARDGHDFVATALAAGAAGSLVSRPVDGPQVIVPDVLKGLEAMGLAARERCAAVRCAVTGSVGKTSVTQAMAGALRLAGPAHSSVKSYNNHIGVPLTLARMPAATRRAVFEVGMNHAGEITPLSRMIAPDVALITTVGAVHTENFPDGEAGVARAKAEIFAGLKNGGVAVLPADNRWFDMLKTAAERAGARVLSFGRAGGDARLTDVVQGEGGVRVTGEVAGKAVDLKLRQSGLHWGSNAMAVLLSLTQMDVSLETGMAALESFGALSGRGEEIRLGGYVLVDESYNANPISMASTIATLGARKDAARRIVVLTDMLELGEEGPVLHAALARDLEAAHVDLAFCAGQLMKSLWEALPSTRRGGYAERAEDLAPLVTAAVEPGDVVMVKGSNGSKAHLIAKALMAAGEGGE